MRKLLIAAASIAVIPCTAIMAQETRVTTTVTTQAPATVNPETVNSPPAPSPRGPAAMAAQPGPDGVIHEMGPRQVVAQAVPPPAAAYPPCVKGRTDSCYNPDPNKEADVRRDGTIGE